MVRAYFSFGLNVCVLVPNEYQLGLAMDQQTLAAENSVACGVNNSMSCLCLNC